MNKTPTEKIDGVLLLDKPAGITSNIALQRTKRLFHAAKAGHTGTLDPLATGLLPICLGEATKFSSSLLEADKTYQAIIKLGRTTTTADAEGEIIAERPVNVELEQIEKVLKSFTGAIQQIPPMYSALKYQGKALYKYARQGETIERPARAVTIYNLYANEWNQNEYELTVTAVCSKGTYIRVLAEDIGNALGCGGHLKKLRRVTIGTFDLSRAVELGELEQLSFEQRRTQLLPVDSLMQKKNKIVLKNNDLVKIAQGQVVTLAEREHQGVVSLYDESNGFWGLGEINADYRIRAVRLIAKNL